MARWRQVFNKETGKSEFIPLDDAARRADGGGVAIHGVFEPFVSPVDGSVISTAKQLREHNARNNVVQAEEFSPEYYARKAEERARFYNKERTREEVFRDRQQIYDTITRLENG